MSDLTTQRSTEQPEVDEEQLRRLETDLHDVSAVLTELDRIAPARVDSGVDTAAQILNLVSGRFEMPPEAPLHPQI